MVTTLGTRTDVGRSVRRAPVVAVVRTASPEEALRQARAFAAGGAELVEITFTVPGAPRLIRELIAARGGDGPPWYGAGTVTTAARAREAAAAGAEFLVTPNVSREVAEEARRADLFLVLGALTPSEIVAAHELGADLVKVYPLPPVGGAAYLATVRQPLGDLPMLAAGGFGVEEIPAYRQAGAVAFGIGAPLLGDGADETRRRVARAIELARAGAPAAEAG
jgi:2-dehydro-3-deoxyphosphogluconate aldolase/(4S)-4-hydroxy-2-oxoglutarate aldolase